VDNQLTGINNLGATCY